jgi:hypothetical protein
VYEAKVLREMIFAVEDTRGIISVGARCMVVLLQVLRCRI